MSGSPLLQNGKLIGAVTHVLVDDPTKGYAIFAEILGVSVEELMQIKKEGEVPVSKVSQIIEIVPKAVSMAMGIAVTVLAILDELPVNSGMIMLGIGLACVGISLMSDKK